MKRHTKRYPIFIEDIFIGIVIVLIAFILLFSSLSQTSGNAANIYKNNVLQKRVSLLEPSITPIGNMVIEVKDHKIRVKDSDCPLQICVHKGWISQKNQVIVCVPNHVLIEIEGEGVYQGYAK